MNPFLFRPLTMASVLALTTLGSTASAQQSPATGLLTDEIVVIGTRTEVNRNDLPMQVSVITAEDIRNSGSVNVAEILSDSGEIYIRESGSSGGRITLRGMAHSDTLYLIDGMRLNGELNKTYELDRIPAGMIERIEVLKGSASLLYGSEAMGGVVNIITRKSEEGFDGDIQLLHGANRNGIDLNLFASQGNTRYRLLASHLERDAFTGTETAQLSVSNTPISQLRGAAFAPLRASLADEYVVNRDYQDNMSLSHLSAGLQHRFSEQLSLDLGTSFLREDKGRDFISANYLTVYQNNRGRPVQVQRLPSEQSDDNSRLTMTAALEYSPLTNLDIRYSLFFSRYDKDTRAYTPFWREVGYSSKEASMSNLNQSVTEHLNQDLTASYSFSARNRLLVGAEHRTIDRDSVGFVVNNGTHEAVFVQHEFKPVEELSLVYGARHERDPADESKTSISLGGSYALHDGLWLKSNFSQGFRSADAEELYINQTNINGRQLLGATVIDGSKTDAWSLRPETSETVELGILAAGNRYRFELFGFETRFNDRISRKRLDNTTTTYDNIEKSRINGFESTLKLNISDNFSTRLTYANTDAKNQTDDSKIYRTPESLASVQLSYFPRPQVEMRSISKYTGRQVDADGNIPSFTSSNVKLIYSGFIQQVDLAAGIDNIFREHVPEQLGAIRKSAYYASVRYNFR